LTENLRRFLDEVREAQQDYAAHLAARYEPGSPDLDDVDLDDDVSPGRCGQAFRELATSLGLPCPDELVALGDALETGRVWLGDWELLDPKEAVSIREFLSKAVAYAPALRAQAQMLPLFSRDGDRLLLGADGSISLFLWSGPREDHGPVAETLDDLLGLMLRGERLPFDPVGP
jgi:hypothetical protein